MEFIRINNRDNFLIGDIPQYHPESAKYISFWREQKKRCIEGFWNQDTRKADERGMWRFMPPNLYFYVNFGTILHRPEGTAKTAPKKRIRPYLRDLEWEFFYNFMEARGFSGFSDDEEYTCCRDVVDEMKTEEEYDPTCFNTDGEVKKYISARKYIRQLFDQPMGLPLYQNEAKNLFLLGARGGGKSYMTGVGIVLHELLFDGARVYDEDSIKNPARVEIFVGAALSSKSAETLSKARLALANLPGVWKENTEDEIPSPFYKEMAGTLSPNNMKNPWRHEYEKNVNGKWKKLGSGSSVKHGIFTVENPEAAAGTRPGIILIEEVGLMPNVLTVHGSNEAAQMTDGTVKFGSAIYIGTGGNVDKIVESEIIFRDPDGFNFLSFHDEWEGTGHIGWFVPAYYMDGNFKDENGNTKKKIAIEHYEKSREKKKSAKSSTALDMEMMNYPLVPSEMFLNKSNNKFPISDLKARYAKLMSDRKILDSSWKGQFVIDATGGIKFNNVEGVEPIREFPVTGTTNIEGCVEIYEHPVRGEDGKIPWGVYIAGLDPVDDDGNDDYGRSLQSTFVMNVLTDRVVAEYTGRTRYAKDYYEQVRRLLMYYNAILNYENQKKGLYAYFEKKNCLYLLAETPEILRDKEMQKASGIGNKSLGTYATGPVNNWGLDLQNEWLGRQAYGKPENVENVNILRSVGYIKECIAYNGEINTDRVSSMGMLLIYRESIAKQIEDASSKKKVRRINDDPFWDQHLPKMKSYGVGKFLKYAR